MHDSRPFPSSSANLTAWQGERWAFAFVIAMALTRAFVAAHIPLSADEGYYWQWTRPLQLSYYDHPAMVAYWIWAGLRLLGETTLGVRAMAVLGACVATALVWDVGRLAFRSRRVGALAAVWLNSTILFGSAGIIVTPDSPLLLAWSFALWGTLRLIDRGQARYLYVIGLALGLGAISKYTMILVVPGLLACFLLFRRLHPWWRSPHLYAAALLALLATTPLLVWNVEHEGASFAKQLSHAFAGAPPPPLKSAAGWLGSQAGLVTPLIFAFCLFGMVWTIFAGWRQERPEWFVLGATSLPLLVFFLAQALHGTVQAHWAGPAYLGGVVGATGACSMVRLRRAWRWAFIAAPILGTLMALAVFLQAATALLPIPTKIDVLKRLGGWRDLAQAVAAERLAHPGTFLLTPKHEPTGIVSFYLPDHAPVFLQGHIRPSYYTTGEVAALKGHDAIFITRAREDAARDIAPYFSRVTQLRQVVLTWGGHPADAYNLYFAEGYRGGALTMGDGLDGAVDRP
jgi:4-amino-4-deoxy-L-arabinose transferase-like glycosyltransferase